MILGAALMLATQPAPPAEGEAESEIVVLANLRSVSVNVGQDREGRWHCSLNRTTGRAKLDDKLCRAVTKCVRKGAADDAAVDACIRTSRAGLVREVERSMKKGSK